MSNPFKAFDHWANTWTSKPESETKQMARSLSLLAIIFVLIIAVAVTYILLWITYPYLTLGLHSIPLILFILWLIKD